MFIPLLVILLLLDTYVFAGIQLVNDPTGNLILTSFYWGTVAFTLFGIYKFSIQARKGLSTMNPKINLLFGLALSFVVFNLFFAILLVGEDVFRVIAYVIQRVFSAEEVHYASRNSIWNLTSLTLSSIPFFAMAYGAVEGKYRCTTRTTKLQFNNLPSAFEGFRVVQFSDAHLGSFDSLEGLRKGLQSIQNAKPDIILFTGDMVNNLASEAKPYIDEFKKLTAPFGKYSILGNHDYGSYVKWPSQLEQKQNLENLKSIQAEMGFKMLHNQHVMLNKDGEQICLAGVENWGKPPFPQYGDLDKALNGVPYEMLTILMSHDPSHWDLQVKQYPKPIQLTLSGHTHGMQFGIDLPFFKWSPVKWKYPKWAGLYEESARYLYVNRGFGFLGYPGRAGIWPEITVLELSKKN